MLDARLTSAFGNGRAKTGGSGSGGPSNTYSDFGWILKKKKIRIGRDGPTIARRPSASLVGLKRKEDKSPEKKSLVS